MKTVSKTILAICMVAAILSSCNYPAVTLVIRTERSQTHITTVFSTPLPLISSLSPAETSVPTSQNSTLIVSGTPITNVLENGLTWTECVLPYRDYFHVRPDIELFTGCVDMEFPILDESDKAKYAEHIRGVNGDNLRLVVGDDIFETRYTQSNVHDYELLKNGEVFAKASANFVTFDPNRSLGYLGEKIVWEIISEPPALIVDGVNINVEYQLEGSYFPYEVNGKLIYLAKMSGKYHIMYNGKKIGPEFDEISLAYCCAKLSVAYGRGQYWFLGRRNGGQYVVAIH